jgi:hypothetical protein
MEMLMAYGWRFEFIDGQGWQVTDPIGGRLLSDRHGLYWLDLREAIEAAEYLEERDLV